MNRLAAGAGLSKPRGVTMQVLLRCALDDEAHLVWDLLPADEEARATLKRVAPPDLFRWLPEDEGVRFAGKGAIHIVERLRAFGVEVTDKAAA